MHGLTNLKIRFMVVQAGTSKAIRIANNDNCQAHKSHKGWFKF